MSDVNLTMTAELTEEQLQEAVAQYLVRKRYEVLSPIMLMVSNTETVTVTAKATVRKRTRGKG